MVHRNWPSHLVVLKTRDYLCLLLGVGEAHGLTSGGEVQGTNGGSNHNQNTSAVGLLLEPGEVAKKKRILEREGGLGEQRRQWVSASFL